MIIKPYWGSGKEEEQKESFIRNYLRVRKIKRFFMSNKEIKHFKVSYDKNRRFIIYYSLKGNNLKYYANLTLYSFLFYKDYVKILYDDDWLDYEQGILKKGVLV